MRVRVRPIRAAAAPATARAIPARAWLDPLGAALLAAWLAWTSLAGLVTATDATPVLLLIATCAATYAAARIVARAVPPAVPAAALLVAAFVLARAWPDVVSGQPYARPLGYSNANAALAVQGAIAGLLLVAVARRPWLRYPAALAAVACAALPFVTDVRAAALLVLLLPAGLLAIARWRGPRTAIAVAAGAVGLAFATTLALAVAYDPADRDGALDAAVAATLTERRVVLWREALDLAAARPLTGHGARGFVRLSATARSDGDASWAHSGFLQHAAEFGVPALLLMLAAFAWAFARLALSPDPGAAALLAAAALAALGVHATIDYVLHFPLVPMTASALLGGIRPR